MPIAWLPKDLVISDCRRQAVSRVLAMRLSSATSLQASPGPPGLLENRGRLDWSAHRPGE